MRFGLHRRALIQRGRDQMCARSPRAPEPLHDLDRSINEPELLLRACELARPCPAH